jgi:hypothetical protein
MTQQTSAAAPQTEPAERPSRTEMSVLRDLVTVLKPHARGLRKWSVMRAMRESRLRQSRDISLKFEQDVERIFRRYCVGEATLMACTAETAPFFRPRDTAGEVWALHPDRAEALLGAG